ncbi:MAG TPA: sodium:solute symporter family protein [Pyrinomonadaceae bacterium]|nr:sodium:solute symporter family protein [Pyrinomonadaceae bacterium]
MTFGFIDWLVLGLYLIITVAAGLYAKRYVENLSGYMVAGRRVGLSLGVATFAATELGTITFMYFAELGYVTGFSCFIIGLLAMFAYMFVGKTGFIIERLREVEVMTIPEYYQLRYSRNVRLLGGIILFVGGVLNMGIFLKFDGIFLSEVMGFGPSALAVIMVVMIIVVVLYTVLGGMFSVVVTDYMQFVVLTIGVFVALVAVLMHVDLGSITEAVHVNFGASGVNPLLNPRFGWMFIVWILISNVAAGALWQPGTSKALSSENPEVARKVFFYTSLTFAGRAMIPMFIGVAALAYFGPDLPPTSAMPKLLGLVTPNGFLGLLVAGMLAASMSTYSAYLLAWSSVITRDVIACFREDDFDERSTIWITRAFAVLIGAFLLIFGLWYQIPDTAFQYLFITGAMYTAGALGAVAAGIYWKKANNVGAYASLVMGAIAPAGFLLLEKSRDSLPSWLAIVTDVNVSGVLSFVLAAAGMYFGSILTQTSCPPRMAPRGGSIDG